MKILTLTFLLSFTILAKSQDYKVVKFNEVEKMLKAKNDTLYVLNFWATWCQPCVKELPYFEEVNAEYKDEKMQLVLISMDFKSDLTKRVEPFLEKQQLKSTVWFLDETKQNDFIPKVEDGWSGAIPFTIMVRGSDGFRYWKEGKWTLKELHDKINEVL